MGFSDSFIWGAATASYQIEGAANEDGRGASVWDMLCRRPGAIWNGQTGDIASDHYHHFREDVALMKEIGLKGYRFSISWSRVLPEGIGAVNQSGLDFYDRLVDELIAADILPFITLFHWDFPYELFCRGGWLNRDSADWFADYTSVVVEKLSDRARHWMTLNEPQCFIGIGHLEGEHAPGLKLGMPEMLRAGHHALLAHGKAVQAIRTSSKSAAQVGYAPAAAVKIPNSDSTEDIEAARDAMFSMGKQKAECPYWNNTWWMDPVYFGRYPEDGLRFFEEFLPPIHAGDMETICQPLDFFGCNLYHGVKIRAGADGKPEEVPAPVGQPISAMAGFPTVPESIYWGSKFYWERYGLPIVITENGYPAHDAISSDGKVHDPNRIDYTRRYLSEFARAIDDGVKASGYFHWSLIDNFEWAEGYKERLGLIFIDYPTQRRILKDSAHFYKEVIATNGKCLEERQV